MKKTNYRKTAAVNTRGVLFKYYSIDGNKDFAVPAGRCKCGKITDLYCSNCYKYICENHLFRDEKNYFCENCKTEARKLTKKEIRKIRKAKF